MVGGESAGGSQELARLIDGYGEYLVPELQHYFGLDLRDVLTYDISPRFVLIHINWLPLESAFSAEVRGGQKFRGWSEDRYMRAGLINATRAQSHLFVLANIDAKKTKKPPAPEPYPIPDGVQKVDQTKKPGSFAAMAAAQMAAAKRKEGT